MHSSFLLFPNMYSNATSSVERLYSHILPHTHTPSIHSKVGAGPADRQTANKTNIRTNKQHQHLKSIARNAIPFIFAPFWRTAILSPALLLHSTMQRSKHGPGPGPPQTSIHIAGTYLLVAARLPLERNTNY